MWRHLVWITTLLSTAIPFDASANAKDAPRITMDTVVNGTPQSIWALWTTPEGLQRFLARSARVGTEVGSEFSIDLGAGYLVELSGASPTQIRAWDPPRTLAFDWIVPLPGGGTRDPKTVVTVQIEPADNGKCRVRLEHSGWTEADAGGRELEYSKQYWKVVLQKLRKAATASGLPQPSEVAGGK